MNETKITSDRQKLKAKWMEIATLIIAVVVAAQTGILGYNTYIFNKNTEAERYAQIERGMEIDVSVSNRAFTAEEYRYLFDTIMTNLEYGNVFAQNDVYKIIDAYTEGDSIRRQSLKEAFDLLNNSNKEALATKTVAFHKMAVDCFSENEAIRLSGLAGMVDNFDVKNIDDCIASMLEIVEMSEFNQIPRSSTIGYTNFANFICIHTPADIYNSYADKEQLKQLITKLKALGNDEAKDLLTKFDSIL